MRRTCLKIRFMANVLILMLVLPALASAEMEFNQIISFGASLSDPGNAFALKRIQSTPPYDNLSLFLVPDAPYAKGGHHFSNGDTWIEQFARGVGLPEDANPAFSYAGTNYAVGGARAYDDGLNFNLSDQVSMFLVDFDNMAPSDALYTMEIGGNDIRDALETESDTILSEALSKIFLNILTLYQKGAKKFLVWNAPDIGLTPALKIADIYALQLDPDTPDDEMPTYFATYASELFNYNLSILLDSLRNMLIKDEDFEIVLFDSFQIMHKLVAHPDDYGLDNTNNACVEPNSPPFQCKKPDEYLFWDGIHPTKAVHGILADEAVMLLY